MTPLYFLRHGRADRTAWSGSDFERPLTSDGRQRLHQQVKAYKHLNLGIHRVLSSPLVRARQTAEIVAQGLGLSVEIAPTLALGFDYTDLTALLTPARESGWLLVGHEPDFSEVIARLIGAPAHAVVMKKGSLARVDLFDEAQPRGELAFLLPGRILLERH